MYSSFFHHKSFYFVTSSCSAKHDVVVGRWILLSLCVFPCVHRGRFSVFLSCVGSYAASSSCAVSFGPGNPCWTRFLQASLRNLIREKRHNYLLGSVQQMFTPGHFFISFSSVEVFVVGVALLKEQHIDCFHRTGTVFFSHVMV